MIINLSNLQNVPIEEIGGKAKNLGTLINKGYPVPRGFVITASSNEDIPPAKQGEILEAFDKLGSPFVAVRSSAVAEDGKENAWAGQLDSFLNVRREELMEKIRLCQDSIHNPRAITYAKGKGYTPEDLQVAVIVQEMVDSDVSGVAFSVNPVTEDPDQLVIEAVYGLGEAIVSGSVTPDTYVVSKKTHTITKSIAEQQKKLVLKHNENTWVSMPKTQRDLQKLSDTLIAKLTDLVVDIEKLYGYPMDIEWAMANNQLYLTQVRPITTLKHKPTHKPLYEPGTKIFRWGPIPGRWFYMAEYAEALFADHADKYMINNFPKANMLIKDKELVWLLAEDEFFTYCSRLFDNLLDNMERLNKLNTEWEVSIAQLTAFEKKIDTSKFTKFNQWQTLTKKYILLIKSFWEPTLTAEFAGYGSEMSIRRLLSPYIKDERELGKAIQILTTPGGMSFFQKADIELVNSDDLEGYANKYFWLANSYGGVTVLDSKHFQEVKSKLDPLLVANTKKKRKQNKAEKRQVIQRYGLNAKVVSACDLATEIILVQDRRKAFMMKTQHYKEKILKSFANRYDILVDDMRNISLREIAQARSLKKLKELIAERKAGLLGITQSRDSNIFHFYSAEEVLHFWRHYLVDKQEEIGSDFLRGLVASRSSAIRHRGRVQVVDDPDDPESFIEGSILVTQMTSPAYIQLMKKSSGIITDTGGLTSHAAIISRELGLPCIVGTRFATQTLKTGDLVEMDTHGGTIKVLQS